MNRVILSILAVVLTAHPAVAWAESPAPPVVAFDILKTDIDLLLKNSPPAIDQQIRVVDMGQYNLGVGIVHRGPTNDKPGDPITVSRLHGRNLHHLVGRRRPHDGRYNPR
jgi:hypothetical protein